MAPALVNTWTASQAATVGFVVPAPAILGTRVPVANTGGHWLVAVLGWRQPPLASGISMSMSVADDAHNYWIPVGAPSGTSSASGVTRTSIWVCPNARAATNVFVAPTGPFQAYTVAIFEISGMGTGYQLGASIVTGFANNATSLPLSLAVPSGASLMLAADTSDNLADTVTFTGTGWTGIAGVTASNGTDNTSDCRLGVNMIASNSSAQSVSWTSSPGALDFSGVIVAILNNVTAPAGPNPNWPRLQLLAAPGSGAGTPPDQMTWVDWSNRLWPTSEQRGPGYELGATQAAQSSMVLDNNDGGLDPTNSAGPYFGQLQTFTPVRLLATWQNTTYAESTLYITDFGQAWGADRWGQVTLPLVDIWGALTTPLQPCMMAEILLAQPYAYFPINDSSGPAVNQAPGNSLPLQQIVSKHGAGAATAKFGDTSYSYAGAPGATVWTQTGIPNTTAGQSIGYSLLYTDPDMPSPATGMSVCFVFNQPIDEFPAYNWVVWTMKNAKGIIAQIYIDSSYNTHFQWFDSSGTGHDTVIPIGGYVTSNIVTITMSATGWAVNYNGNVNASGTWTVKAAPSWMTLCGQADPLFTGRMFSASFAQFAIFPYVISQKTILSLYAAWLDAFAGNPALLDFETLGERVERLLSYGGYGIPRLMLSNDSPRTGASRTPNSFFQMVDYACAISDIGGTQAGFSSVGQFLPPTGGQAVSQAITNIVTSDLGLCYIDGTGALVYVTRSWNYNIPPKWVLGDGAPGVGGEIPYEGDINFNTDATKIFNNAQLTPLNKASAIGSVNGASITQNGTVAYQQTSYLANDDPSQELTGGDPWQTTVGDVADWITNIEGTAKLRLSNITVSAAGNPSNWPFVLGVEIGDVVTVNRRPWGAPMLTGTFRVLTLRRTLDWTAQPPKASVSLVLVPYTMNVLTCDDSVRGLLDGTHPLGY